MTKQATTQSLLSVAKAAKADEYYTQWVDIDREMNAYAEYNPNVFRGKVVLLPCDDPEWSNFTKYNPDQFEIVGTTESNDPDNVLRTRWYSAQECRDAYLSQFGKPGVYDLNASGVVEGVKVYERVSSGQRTPHEDRSEALHGGGNR